MRKVKQNNFDGYLIGGKDECMNAHGSLEEVVLGILDWISQIFKPPTHNINIRLIFHTALESFLANCKRGIL